MQAGLHGAEALAGELGDLFERPVAEVAERDGQPLVGRQLRERTTHRVPFAGRAGAVGDGRVGGLVEVDEPDPPASTQPVTAAVDEDPVEPRVEPRTGSRRSPNRAQALTAASCTASCASSSLPEQHRGEPVGADEMAVGEPHERRLAPGRALGPSRIGSSSMASPRSLMSVQTTVPPWRFKNRRRRHPRGTVGRPGGIMVP